MADSCCQTNEEGDMVCVIAEHEKNRRCSADAAVIPLQSIVTPQQESVWQKIRGGVMFSVACVTSPCCTPLIVPVILAFLAGTPIAAWLNAHVGGIYALLTLISLVSLVLALRWSAAKKKGSPERKSRMPEISTVSTIARSELS